MTVGLRQVAESSGVSVSTASRALSGSLRISDSTRARVEAVAAALDYHPNAAARSLRTARSQVVGLVLTNLVNSSLRTIAEVVQQRLALAGLNLVLSITGGDTAQERAAVRSLVEHNAVGVVLVGADIESVSELARRKVAVVHLARRPDRPAGDCVLGDDVEGAAQAVRYLLGLGHVRVGIVAGPPEVTSGRERLDGFHAVMRGAGPAVTEWVYSGPFAPATGAAAVASLLAVPPRARPTALLVANHEAAFGALPALREAGVAIPEHLSLVCFEDAELLRWWHPGVTVLDNGAAEMGRLATDLLLARVSGKRTGSDNADFRVATRLLVRESCAAPPDDQPLA